jgi:hypothetical protein
VRVSIMRQSSHERRRHPAVDPSGARRSRRTSLTANAPDSKRHTRCSNDHRRRADAQHVEGVRFASDPGRRRSARLDHDGRSLRRREYFLEKLGERAGARERARLVEKSQPVERIDIDALRDAIDKLLVGQP